MSFPFESEPFYMRPLLIIKSLLGGFYTSMVYLIIPIAVAMVIIFAVFFFGFGILAAAFGWNLNSDQIKAKREKEKEREPKEIQGKSGVELSNSPVPDFTSDSRDTVDLEKRLEIEIELLGEMVVARRERLAALRKKMNSEDGSDLEVLEKE
ncbi:hypothetical protein N7447_009445 [Penicillium robsamsonii]|uniref:uncharacterized protein n=1 Tax=Penicillium robsamsonii TaxID=1792511 RepID=UPI0025487D5B|nr:uncharacterized protein N7447_009445 [Penicillium robsamsonii]KAJ5817212.1 hypothetical protein N7447_009445 [Penicillium robsamsonii]